MMVRNLTRYRENPLVSLRAAVSLIFCVLLLGGLVSCGKVSHRTALARRLGELEGNEADTESVRRLKRDIRAVDASVEKTIQAVKDEATYWRLLGLKYMDYEMWGKAIEAFDEAIMIEPNHAVLLHKRALCAGQMALSTVEEAARTGYIDQARAGYRRVLAIDPRYTPAMYALAVILVFETGEYLKAADLLEDFLKIERSDIRARFLLARSYVEIGRTKEALDVYDDIVRDAANDEDRQKAEDLYHRIAEGNYGA